MMPNIKVNTTTELTFSKISALANKHCPIHLSTAKPTSPTIID